MRNIHLLDIDLRLFDGAAAGAVAGGESAGESVAQDNTGALPKADRNTRNGSSRRSKSGEFSNVVYGKQEEATPAADASVTPDAGETTDMGKSNTSGVSTTSDSKEAKRAAFKELIEGEYKDEYTAEFNAYFNRRFKEAKGMEADLSSQKPIIDMLMQRYNIGDGDISKLQKAVEEDDVYWEDAAEKSGLTVEQFKAMQKLERENAELKAIRQKQIGEQQAQQRLNQWYKEAEKVKEVYPSFDFRAETANKQFTDLLKANIPVRQAYELIHMEEIKEAAAKASADATSKQMTARLQSKAARPLENGTSSQSAVIVKNDVSNLSRADRAEIARRAQRGEKITF